ncbi:hypothetical protein HOLleu_24574 [Holothuria leucospilota]|uniref:Uncharacterized protein n=1 Tax=Holothuria leucospilota TaxID=206669 RepID=A0A9Q1BQV8_HOLLE|nr:hypothetical protein HOLleu_24574 [Holothuria leucospilota]
MCFSRAVTSESRDSDSRMGCSWTGLGASSSRVHKNESFINVTERYILIGAPSTTLWVCCRD